MTWLYKDLQPGDTLVSDEPGEDCYTLLRRDLIDGRAYPLIVHFLAHSDGLVDGLCLKLRATFPSRFTVYRSRP